MRASELVLVDHDFAWPSSGQSVHRADPQIRRPIVAFDSFGAKECAQQVRFRFGRNNGEMHELGHVIGLDHVTDQSQIMYPTVTTKLSVFGAGDLAGLQLLGRPAGCMTVPAPPWKK